MAEIQESERDDLEDVADAADLFVKAYYGDHEARAWSIESALAGLQRAIYDYQIHKVKRAL